MTETIGATTINKLVDRYYRQAMFYMAWNMHWGIWSPRTTGFEYGRRPDFTTRLCEGTTERDDGIAQAKFLECEKLRATLEDLADEWGIDLHPRCEEW